MIRFSLLVCFLLASVLCQANAQGFNQTNASNATAVGVQNAQNIRLFEWFRKRSDGAWQRWQRERGGWGMSVGPVIQPLRTEGNTIHLIDAERNYYTFNFDNNEVRRRLADSYYLVVYGQIQAKGANPNNVAQVAAQQPPSTPTTNQPPAASQQTGLNVRRIFYKTPAGQQIMIARHANSPSWTAPALNREYAEISRDRDKIVLRFMPQIQLVFNIATKNIVRSNHGKSEFVGTIENTSSTLDSSLRTITSVFNVAEFSYPNSRVLKTGPMTFQHSNGTHLTGFQFGQLGQYVLVANPNDGNFGNQFVIYINFEANTMRENLPGGRAGYQGPISNVRLQPNNF